MSNASAFNQKEKTEETERTAILTLFPPLAPVTTSDTKRWTGARQEVMMRRVI